MFTAALIVFREVFEIAIILCVILAATRQVVGRSYWIGAGILGGLASVALVACFTHSILQFASQLGQHVFHALVLAIAASLIALSVVWMQQHGREITTQMKALSQSVKEGQQPLYMLAFVIALAILREGSEIVLFLYGIYSGGEATIADLIGGLFLGTCAGIGTGIVMYLGLMRIPVKQLFVISAWLLTFLAAGMVAKAAGHLVKANILPALMNPLWDTSTLLSQHSLMGRFLSILVGYQDQPAAIQVIFYVVTVLIIAFALTPKRRA